MKNQHFHKTHRMANLAQHRKKVSKKHFKISSDSYLFFLRFLIPKTIPKPSQNRWKIDIKIDIEKRHPKNRSWEALGPPLASLGLPLGPSWPPFWGPKPASKSWPANSFFNKIAQEGPRGLPDPPGTVFASIFLNFWSTRFRDNFHLWCCKFADFRSLQNFL